MILKLLLAALLAIGHATGLSPELDSISEPRIDSPSVPWEISQPLNGVTFSRAKPITGASLDAAATYTSRLRPLRGHNSRHSALTAVSRLHANSPSPFNASVSPVSVMGGFSTQYGIECAWDDKPIWLLFDTGSANTWAPDKKVECLASTGAAEDPAACAIGPVRFDKFRHGVVDEIHLFVKYGSGETVSGPMGYADVSCGGIPVTKQQVGLVNSTFWHGNNITSGILGLAYPSITSGFYGQVGEEAIWNVAPYTPWFTKAVMQGLVAPMFSVAIERNSTEGVLAWGGLPPSIDWQRGPGVSTSLIVANPMGEKPSPWKYAFYTIIPDGMKWGEMHDTTKYPFIVDTGSPMISLPPQTIAMSFEPRATYMYQYGAYYAPCDSVPPVFGVVISGRTFYIRPNDLIFQDVIDPATGFCAVALTTGGNGPYVLGDVFLQSVVAVFDVGGAEMRFYSRYYSEYVSDAAT